VLRSRAAPGVEHCSAMRRRTFLAGCALGGGALAAATRGAWADAPPRYYQRTRLLDIHGAPLKSRQIAAGTNYLFHYPYAGTPCFLLNLGHAIGASPELSRADGTRYAWKGGLGPEHSIVAFSAICAHKLAYPTREISFIRFQPERSATSDANVIHCCADHSVYDPAAGARVVSGPAPQPLAAILLDYDAAQDELWAVGTVGAEQFEPFFQKYEFKLALEHGPGKARLPVADAVIVREMTQYCRQTVRC
jgi:Rieske Fe-S protein